MQMGHAPPETHGVPNLKATTTEAGQQTTGLLREALTVGACRRKSSMAQGVVSHPPPGFFFQKSALFWVDALCIWFGIHGRGSKNHTGSINPRIGVTFNTRPRAKPRVIKQPESAHS